MLSAVREQRYPLWRNWNDNFVCRPQRLLHPATVDDVVAVVRDARARSRRIRPVGAGYSYTPLVQTDHDLVSLDLLAGVERVDLAAGTAVVRAGTRLGALVGELARGGAALANLGDVDKQSLAGAIATGTHGTGITIPSLSSQVVALTLVDGRGDVVTLDASTPEELRAAQIGLGALGIVTSVTLKIEPLYSLRIERGAEPFGDLLATLGSQVSSNRNFEFFWFPGDELTYTKRMNLSSTAAAPPSAAQDAVRFANDVVIENGMLAIACWTVRANADLRSWWLRLGRALVPHDASTLPANRAYATPRLLRHYETEYAIPIARAAELLAALDERLRRHPIKTLIPIEVRFSRSEDIPLSAAFGSDVMWVAVHAHRAEDYQEYFDLCEELFLAYGGRPHWGKLHTLKAADLVSRYPRWSDFQRARVRFDPDGLFANGYLDRLLGRLASS